MDRKDIQSSSPLHFDEVLVHPFSRVSCSAEFAEEDNGTKCADAAAFLLFFYGRTVTAQYTLDCVWWHSVDSFVSRGCFPASAVGCSGRSDEAGKFMCLFYWVSFPRRLPAYTYTYIQWRWWFSSNCWGPNMIHFNQNVGAVIFPPDFFPFFAKRRRRWHVVTGFWGPAGWEEIGEGTFCGGVWS